MERRVAVVTANEWTAEVFDGKTVQEVIDWLLSLREKAPVEYRDSLKFEIGLRFYSIYYKREETEEERIEREEREARRKDRIKKGELAELARLLAKYPDGK